MNPQASRLPVPSGESARLARESRNFLQETLPYVAGSMVVAIRLAAGAASKCASAKRLGRAFL